MKSLGGTLLAKLPNLRSRFQCRSARRRLKTVPSTSSNSNSSGQRRWLPSPLQSLRRRPRPRRRPRRPRPRRPIARLRTSRHCRSLLLWTTPTRTVEIYTRTSTKSWKATKSSSRTCQNWVETGDGDTQCAAPDERSDMIMIIIILSLSFPTVRRGNGRQSHRETIERSSKCFCSIVLRLLL